MPSDIDAETAVLGAMLMDSEANAIGCDAMVPDHFYSSHNRRIFVALMDLQTQGIPPDLTTLSHELKSKGYLETIGGNAKIVEVTHSVATSANIKYHAEIVARIAHQRFLYNDFSGIVDSCLDSDCDLEKVIKTIQKKSELADKYRGNKYLIGRTTKLDLMKMKFPPVVWAVPGWIPQGATILCAKSKAGKTLLALHIADAVSCGGVVCGKIDVKQGRVLYLALDDPLDLIQERLISFATEPNTDFHVETHTKFVCRVGDGLLRQLTEWCTTYGDARLIVIDVWAKARPQRVKRGDIYQEDYEDLSIINEWACAHGIAVIITHHSNKSKDDDPTQTISGSMGVTGAVSAYATLTRVGEEKLATLHITGNRVRQQSLSLRFTPEVQGSPWELIGVASKSSSGEKISDREGEVYDMLLEHKDGLRATQVADALDVGVSTASKFLHRLREKCSEVIGGKRADGHKWKIREMQKDDPSFNFGENKGEGLGEGPPPWEKEVSK